MKKLLFLMFLVSVCSFGQTSVYGAEYTDSQVYSTRSSNHYAVPDNEKDAKPETSKREAIQKNVSQTIHTRAYSIYITRDVYGLHFNKNNSGLTADLVTKLTRFIKNTSQSEYQGIGSFYVTVVYKNGNYYVVTDSNYNSLILLD